MPNIIRTLLLAAALALGFGAAASADPFEDGVVAAKRGDFEAALKLWRPLADQGNAAAQVNIGSMYATGQGVTQDHAEAAKFYRKAANQGNTSGQQKLGFLYAAGLGVKKDVARAFMWFTLAGAKSSEPDGALALKARDSIFRDMTPAQIAEGQKLAGKWKPSK
jgi:TPR repeat protein